MPVTIIKSITVQVPTDASIVFDDTSGIAQVRRGNLLMASDAGSPWEIAARQLASIVIPAWNPAQAKVCIIDGGLCVIPRILTKGSVPFLVSELLFSHQELMLFAFNRYPTVSPSGGGSWTMDFDILATLGALPKFHLIFLSDLSFPVTPAQLQPFALNSTGMGVFYPGGFLPGTAAS